MANLWILFYQVIPSPNRPCSCLPLHLPYFTLLLFSLEFLHTTRFNLPAITFRCFIDDFDYVFRSNQINTVSIMDCICMQNVYTTQLLKCFSWCKCLFYFSWLNSRPCILYIVHSQSQWNDNVLKSVSLLLLCVLIQTKDATFISWLWSAEQQKKKEIRFAELNGWNPMNNWYMFILYYSISHSTFNWTLTTQDKNRTSKRNMNKYSLMNANEKKNRAKRT